MQVAAGCFVLFSLRNPLSFLGLVVFLSLWDFSRKLQARMSAAGGGSHVKHQVSE